MRGKGVNRQPRGAGVCRRRPYPPCIRTRCSFPCLAGASPPPLPCCSSALSPAPPPPWILVALAAPPAPAGPLEFVSPRDPLVAELRVLECYDLPADSGRVRRPLFSRLPLQRMELMGDGAPIGRGSPVRTLVADRIERELQRDAVRAFSDARVRRSTPRAWQREWPGDE